MKSTLTIRTIVAVLVTFALTSLASAAVPQAIPYQGRLVDNLGDPVSDGAHLVKFIIYDASVAGNELWNSGFQNVTTANGLFSYGLGSNVALPDNLFADTSRYLGITVGVDPEITPRTRFESSAYAYQALRSDSAGYATTAAGAPWSGLTGVPAGFADGTDANSGGDVTEVAVGEGLSVTNSTGPIPKISVPDGAIKSIMISDGTIVANDLASNSVTAIKIATGSITSLKVLDEQLTSADLAPNSVGASEIQSNAVGASEIVASAVGASEIATSAVGASEIATNAVGTSEVLNNSLYDIDLANEPGIAAQQDASVGIALTSTMQDVETIEITIPEDGYILVTGKCYLRTSGSTVNNQIFTQIDETAGGGAMTPYLTKCGMGTYPTTGNYYYNAIAIRTYFKTPGTYTFRLEANQNSLTHSGFAFHPMMTAMYFPTSYGPTVASVSEAIEGSRPMQVMIDEDPSVTRTVYEVDLRKLELAAKELRIKTLEAEQALRDAKEQAAQAQSEKN